MKNKNKSENGSMLLLVMIAVLIITLIGLAGLANTSTDMATARNYRDDKVTLLAADSGVNYAMDQCRNYASSPENVSFNKTDLIPGFNVRTGLPTDPPNTAITGMNGFQAPPSRGESQDAANPNTPLPSLWVATVSAIRTSGGKSRIGAVKEIECVLKKTMTGTY